MFKKSNRLNKYPDCKPKNDCTETKKQPVGVCITQPRPLKHNLFSHRPECHKQQENHGNKCVNDGPAFPVQPDCNQQKADAGKELVRGAKQRPEQISAGAKTA